MPPQAGFDPSSVAQDKDFRSAPFAEQVKYLAAQDQDFAKAAPGDQRGYIQHLLGTEAPAGVPQVPRPVPPGLQGPPDPPVSLTSLATQPSQFAHANPLRYFDEIGQGMAQGGQMLVHPINTAKNTYEFLAQPLRDDYAVITGKPRPKEVPEPPMHVGDVADMLAQTYGQFAALGGAGKALDVTRGGLNQIVPSTTRAGAGLKILTDSPDAAFAKHPVDTTNALTAARKIESELAVTGEKPPQQIQHYLSTSGTSPMVSQLTKDMQSLGYDHETALARAERAAALHPGDLHAATDAAIKGEGAEPVVQAPQMPMYEARTMLKRVNDIIRQAKGFNADAQSRMAINNLKRFAGALDQDISAAAQKGGFGADYENMRNEYRRGSQIVRAGEEIGAPVGALAGYELGRMGGEPLGGTMIGGVIGKKVGKYTTGAMARGIVQRNAGPPQLRSVPPTPEQYYREIIGTSPATQNELAAKYGVITASAARARAQRNGDSLKVRPIPQP